MHLSFRQLFTLLAATTVFLWGCGREIVPAADPEGNTPSRIIPENCEGLPSVYIDTPEHVGIFSKLDWVKLSTIRIEAVVDGKTVELYNADSLKIKGHGNTTWTSYPKKPYSLKLKHKADFIGTGKTTRWILLANWMDRTHLRNDVAFEAARLTSLEWAPSGTFVHLHLNGVYLGLYWLGERIHVEGSNFLADYLYSLDTSDLQEQDFLTWYGRRRGAAQDGDIPVELKYPDRDDFTEWEFNQILKSAESTFHTVETNIHKPDAWASAIDTDSFCDWFLVNELCFNNEPLYPKSTFMYYKNNKMYAGPVWDFDWGSFTWNELGGNHLDLNLKASVYFYQLYPQPAFRKRLKERWRTLKPQFEKLTDYIDQRAALIREADDYWMWPCYPNPLAEAGSGGLVNNDENLSFDAAVTLMKENLLKRISAMDNLIRNLQ